MRFILHGFFVIFFLILTGGGGNSDISAQVRVRGISVSGVVLDESGKPLPGVAVYTPAKDEGTTTDADGKFILTLKSRVEELCFSFLGYKDLTVKFDEVDVVHMEPAENSIMETVVTGIYERKAESFTGAVNTVRSEDIKRVSNANVFEALKNIDPSLMILDNLDQGSNPNAMASMQLRGASSFMTETTSLKSNFVNDANMPLFILDGFETTVEKIQDMDMNRVESITILKDASAKAIYGSKAGNGVIVIETKQLRSDQTLVSYTGSVSIEAPDLTSYNLCNALEKLEIERREGYYRDIASSTEALIDAYNLYNSRLKKALEGESTYWLSKPLRTGLGHKHALSVELGSKELKALVSLGYNDTQGAMKGSYRKVISGDVNLSYRRNRWLFRNIMSVSNMNSEDSPYGNFSEYTLMNPYDSPYTEDGEIKKEIVFTLAGSDYDMDNPMYNAYIGTRIASDYINVTDNLYIEYNVIDPLKIVARFGIDTKRAYSEEFLPGDHTEFSNIGSNESDDSILSRGSYEATNGVSTTFSGDVSAQFNHSFPGGHDLFATGQYSISQTKYSEVTHYAEGFPSNNMNSITFARQYAADTTPTGSDGLNRNLGLLLTVGYGYKDRYMLDATLKGSASSVFGTNSKWGTFWSAGVAWNLHKENFLANASSWLKQLKLRYSMGSSGNQNYSSNRSLPVYSYYNSSYYNGFAGATLTNMENPDMGWEQTTDYNIGLDFKTQRITMSVDAYIADTENMVFTRSTLPSTGFSAVSDNLGKVRNKGIEVSASYRIFQKGTNYLSVFAKAAFNKNTVLEISDALRTYNQQQQENADETNATTPVIQYYDGIPLHSIWVVPSLGVDPVSGREIYIDRDGNMTNTWSASDLVNYGSSDPLVNGNFGFNGEVKGIGLSLVCTFYGGGKTYNSTLVNKVENTSLRYNVDRRIYEGRWFEPGQNAVYKTNDRTTTRATSRFVQKNNVLSISSVSLYYEFPTKLIQKAKMSRLRATLYLNDLATFSSIEIERGTSYPYARTFSFSLTATF